MVVFSHSLFLLISPVCHLRFLVASLKNEKIKITVKLFSLFFIFLTREYLIPFSICPFGGILAENRKTFNCFFYDLSYLTSLCFNLSLLMYSLQLKTYWGSGIFGSHTHTHEHIFIYVSKSECVRVCRWSFQYFEHLCCMRTMAIRSRILTQLTQKKICKLKSTLYLLFIES